MSERRQRAVSILLKSGAAGNKVACKVELFPAEAWGGPAGLYRCRVNGRWHAPGPSPYCVAEALAWLLLDLLAELPDAAFLDVAPAVAPDLPRGTTVRVPVVDPQTGATLSRLSRTGSSPIQAADGRWYVRVVTPEQGAEMRPLDDLQEVNRHGAIPD